MAERAAASGRRLRPQHTVRIVHTGAKHLLSNFDAFHLPPPKDQESRYQPQGYSTPRGDTGLLSTTSVQPRWKYKPLNRELQVDTLERHMDICLAWEGETLLEVTTYKKPAGSTVYLKVNRITQWKDGFASSTALYEPSLESFQSTAKGEDWKIHVLRIVYREDDEAWWHVQERMWKDKLRDPFKAGWKMLEREEQGTPAASSTHKPVGASRELGKVSKRTMPWATGSKEVVRAEPVAKRKRRLPWMHTSDKPAQKERRSGGAKVLEKPGKGWDPRADTLSTWCRSRGEIDPDDEEEVAGEGAVKTEDRPAARPDIGEKSSARSADENIDEQV